MFGRGQGVEEGVGWLSGAVIIKGEEAWLGVVVIIGVKAILLI
jgi:hypothetical protein